MNKKLRLVVFIISIIITGVFLIDTSLNLGIVSRFESFFDQEAPVIDTENLRSRYLLNEDVTLDINCQDNIDDLCSVEIVGSIDTTLLGAQSITLIATDKAGNVTTFIYNFEIVDNVDGSMYIPLGYYDGIEGLVGEDLKRALHLIIKDHIEFPYTHSTRTDTWDILREADEDPNNPDNVIGFYTGLSIPKDCQDTTNPPDFCLMEAYGEQKIVEWNREHIWSKSRGDFSDTTSMGAHTDLHHLVAAERVMNSTKNNRYFEDCNDGDDLDIVQRGYGNYTCNIWHFEPRDEMKGDVARMLFYMVVRYEDESLDLELVNDPEQDKNSKLPIYGDIDDLLRWHIEDPVSEREILRNEVIYSYQGNRNPFIDLPQLVELIWGTAEDYN